MLVIQLNAKKLYLKSYTLKAQTKGSFNHEFKNYREKLFRMLF